MIRSFLKALSLYDDKGVCETLNSFLTIRRKWCWKKDVYHSMDHTVSNISILSPTYFVSNTRGNGHRYRPFQSLKPFQLFTEHLKGNCCSRWTTGSRFLKWLTAVIHGDSRTDKTFLVRRNQNWSSI